MIEICNNDMKCMFSNYNKLFAAAYEELLNDQNFIRRLDSEINEEAIKNAVYNSVQCWYDEPIHDENPELTSVSFIDSISTLHDAVELAVHAASLCDDGIPDIVKIKLASFGSQLGYELLKVVLNCDFASSSEQNDQNIRDMIVCTELFKLFSEWEFQEIIDEIIQKFCAVRNPNEMIAEAVRGFLVAVGEPAIPKLTLQINRDRAADSNLDGADEYLLIALADIAKEHHTDAVFACLRDSFRKMSNNAIGAICLGDYGDGRGATVLKSWLDSHPEVTDRQSIAEILSSIKRLGGDISDLHDMHNRRMY